MFGLAGLTALMALVAAFVFGRADAKGKMMPGLKRQRRAVVVAQVMTLLVALVFFIGLYLAQALPRVNDVGSVALFSLPLVAYVFFFLARRSIDKDIGKIDRMNQFRLRD